MSAVKCAAGVLVGVLAAGSLLACSDESSGDDTTPADSNVPVGSSATTDAESGAENASGSYLQECVDKKATGEAMLDASDVGSKALSGDDVEAARAAYVAYYDVYEQDVQSIVALALRIKDDPEAPDHVVEAAEESLAAGEAFATTVDAARDELARADSIEAIGETFQNFQDGLRGPPPGGPQLLPPALFSWMIGAGSDCGAS